MAELEAIALAGTRGGSKQTITDIPIRDIGSTHPMLTHFPVLSGILDPDFTKKPIKGALVPSSRITKFPVLAGILHPNFTKKHIKGAWYRKRG